MKLVKILFAKEILQEDDDYLNFLSLGYKVTWDEQKIYFPLENGDESVILENQRATKIRFKRLSPQYKDGLFHVMKEILKGTDITEGSIRKAIKTIEKGV